MGKIEADSQHLPISPSAFRRVIQLCCCHLFMEFQEKWQHEVLREKKMIRVSRTKHSFLASTLEIFVEMPCFCRVEAVCFHHIGRLVEIPPHPSRLGEAISTTCGKHVHLGLGVNALEFSNLGCFKGQKNLEEKTSPSQKWEDVVFWMAFSGCIICLQEKNHIRNNGLYTTAVTRCPW